MKPSFWIIVVVICSFGWLLPQPASAAPASAAPAGAVLNAGKNVVLWVGSKAAQGWRFAKRHPVATAGVGIVGVTRISGSNPFRGMAEATGRWLSSAIDVVRMAVRDVEQKASLPMLTAGYSLMALFMLIAVAMLGLNWMLDGDIGDVIKGGFELVLVFGLSAWFIDAYDYIFKDSLIGSFAALGGNVAGNLNDPLAASVSSSSSLGAGGSIESSPLYTIASLIGQHMAVIWESGVSLDPFAIGTSVASVGAIFALGAALLLFFVHYMFILVRVVIAHIVAPIFIACLPLKQTRFLFEGWLRYIIACGLALFMLHLMMAVCSGIIGGMPQPGANDPGTLDLATAVLAMILAFTMVKLVQSCENLANELLSGRIGGWESRGAGKFAAGAAMGVAGATGAAAKGGWAAGESVVGGINERIARGQQLRAEQEAAQNMARSMNAFGPKSETPGLPPPAAGRGGPEGQEFIMEGTPAWEQMKQQQAAQAKAAQGGGAGAGSGTQSGQPSPEAVRRAMEQIEAGRFVRDPQLGEDSTAKFAKKRDGSGYVRDDGMGRQMHISNEDWRRGDRGINPDTGAKEYVRTKQPKQPRRK